MEEGRQLTPEETAHELIWSTWHLGAWERARKTQVHPETEQGCLIPGHGEGKPVGSPGSPCVRGLVYSAKLAPGYL